MKATKLIMGLSGHTYEERLGVLQLPTLRYRQLRGDMIQLCKYVNNKYDTNFVLQLLYKSMLVKFYDTRGHTGCGKKVDPKSFSPFSQQQFGILI